MKYSKILPVVVVPLLLVITSTIAYFTINKNWSYEISTYIIFLFTALYILFFERIIPLKPHWEAKKNELWSDLKHLILSASLFDALGKTASLAIVIYLQQFFSTPFKVWNDLPFIIVIIIATILSELLPYFYHRISHIGNSNSLYSWFLWKIHSIHHLPTSLNWFKTSWIHPINIFLNTTLKMVPLLFLGFNDSIIFLVVVTHIVIAYISHANIKTKTGFLDYLITTPQIHHFHHSLILVEAKNFGNITPFWDLIFGTYYNRKGAVNQIGVIKNHIPFPKEKNYIHQLLFPFLKSSKKKVTTKHILNKS
ncbi:sterol desaturase family protein [Aquimarina sediminis]|uniref:sterol desaturase family protein n=1 Tax=Aquimarina sediminis TaxID=2070536 RepID=UPI000CA042F5|nr:sterol desaturase family protein [Aquimarina sediminis]